MSKKAPNNGKQWQLEDDFVALDVLHYCNVIMGRPMTTEDIKALAKVLGRHPGALQRRYERYEMFLDGYAWASTRKQRGAQKAIDEMNHFRWIAQEWLNTNPSFTLDISHAGRRITIRDMIERRWLEGPSRSDNPDVRRTDSDALFADRQFTFMMTGEEDGAITYQQALQDMKDNGQVMDTFMEVNKLRLRSGMGETKLSAFRRQVNGFIGNQKGYKDAHNWVLLKMIAAVLGVKIIGVTPWTKD